MFNNVIKKLTTRCKFLNQVKFFRSLNYFIKLDYLWMLNNFQDVNFSGDSFIVSNVDNFVFLKNLDSDFSLRDYVSSNFNFTKRSFTDCLTQNVLTNLSFMWF